MTPLSNHYLVRRVPSEDRVGALIIPEAYREPGQMFEVLAAGPGRVLDNGTRHPMQAEAGDGVVVLERYFNALPDSMARAYWQNPLHLIELARRDGWTVSVCDRRAEVCCEAPDGFYGLASEDQLSDGVGSLLAELQQRFPVPGLGFLRDDHLIAIDRGDGPEPAGDYVQVARDVRERTQERPSGLLVAAYGLPGGEVRERENAGEAHARSYQADTRIERPRSGMVTRISPDHLDRGSLCSLPPRIIMRPFRVHWERHYEAVAVGEHVYITADQLCAVEVE